MYYDLNIDCQFKDFSELDCVDAKGYCMSMSPKENYRSISPFPVPALEKPIYTRINIEYQNRLDQSIMNSLRKFDIVCIQNVDSANISSVIKLDPDVIGLKIDEVRHIKKSFINTLKEKKLYIEICIRDALYGSREKILWMNSLRRLLKLGCARILVVSTGAQIFTELKTSNDICKILNVFGLSDDNVKKILRNSEDVLRSAALKRYSSRNAIVTNENEGKLKEDFIINYKKRESL
ncbi:uncharacterized protein VICG_01467 [Vittaforma corneae ATCC 50505]|uniref:Uncharacterized protein n=1 Tax=Vittaforma corneae (strain ATCC 50505) TaxID=993615 RepID=L2GKS1_VITCO|nr:uncharacterized protein VICG_01467 [Vittaforma corneae ATCC 50505]ELA41483.1 hypothetical protein VICG_01467 [Vittaforma corneae ATCC 50505]